MSPDHGKTISRLVETTDSKSNNGGVISGNKVLEKERSQLNTVSRSVQK